MSNDTLKEFVVSIKYKTDEESQKTALDGVKSATGALLKLGATIVGAGLAVAAATLKYAEGMNNASLAAARMGMSVMHMRSMTAAAKELGSSVGDIEGSMKSFASFMRKNPFGATSFLAGIGVTTKPGESNDEIMNSIAKRFQEMKKNGQEFMAIAYGEAMGLNESTVISMENPKFNALQDQHNTAQKNNNYEQAGEESNKLIVSADLLNDHYQAALSKGMIPAIEADTKALNVLSDVVDKLNPEVVATTTALKSLAGAATALFAVIMGSGLIKAAIKAVAPSAAAGVAEVGAGATAATLGSIVARASVGAGLMLYSSDLNGGEQERLDAMPKSTTPRDSSKDLGNGGSPTPINKIMGLLIGSGMSTNEAAGMTANFMAESGVNPAAEGDKNSKTGKFAAYGIAQWHQDRQDIFAKKFGHPMRGSSIDEQVSFAVWELRNNEKSAGQKLKAASGSARLAGQTVSRAYERPSATASEALKRGAMAEKIASNYTTTINVHGVSSPQAVADLVAQKQTRIAQSDSRNTQGAHR